MEKNIGSRVLHAVNGKYAVTRDSRLVTRDLILVCLAILLLSLLAAAETLRGTVTNGTTGKPGAGDEVTLLLLGQGMTETGHTTTDSAGHFQFTYDDADMPHLVRVTHQGVGYFRMAPPGTPQVAVQTYDVAARLEGISTTAQVVRFQSGGNELQAVEIHAVQNSSQPPRALAGKHSYEIALPEGAVLDEAGARSPGGQPINTIPEPVPGQPNHYVFSFPLRPGETQFEVSYHLPYADAHAVVNTTLLHPLQHFVAILPTAMQFSAIGADFSPMAGQKDANVQVASNTQSGARLTMSISGSGVLADENAPAENDSASSTGNARPGPGGGLGKPIDSPDPLSHFRWPLLAALAIILLAGGVFVARHRPETAAEVKTPPLLEALKNELFQLEVDRQQGRLSETEYQQAKAGLDLALKRAMKKA